MNKQITEINKVVQNGRIEYIDVLRVLSALSVVFLHTAAGSLRGNIGSPVWHISNVFTAIMSTSVPIFFMLSGAMLMSSDKTLSVKFTYKKRIPKMIVPFLIWSWVAVVYYEVINLSFSGSIGWRAIIKKIVNIPGHSTAVHFWFMYALIPLYLLSPILKKLVDAMTEELTKYLLVIWLVFSSVLPTLISFLPVKYRSPLELDPSYNLNFMNGYLGYFLMGYYLMKYGKQVSKKLLVCIIVIDTVVISLGTWLRTIETGKYSEVFKGYSGLFVLILSTAVFLFVKELLVNRRLPQVASGVVQILSSTSFGVYLLHNLLVDYFSLYKVSLWPANSVYVLFLWYFIILFISLMCIILLASCKLTCFAFTGMTYKNACKTCNTQFFLSKFFASSLFLERWKKSIHS